MTKGLDCFATIRPEWVPQLKALGYGFAARYYRRAPLTGGKGNAVSREEVAALHAHGLAFLPVYQNTSDKPEYFTAENARDDARAALNAAAFHGQPAETVIFVAVDCDPKPSDMPAILAYFSIFVTMLAGEYKIGVYGSGYVCESLDHMVDYTWLSNAKGWRGYKEWLPKADVVQTTLPFTLPFGLQIDGNEARNDAGMWKPKVAKHEPYDPPESWLTRFMRGLLGQRS
jgi:hypothetical protein